jgi:uncharacterized protein involved in type VI secretion and phage assembly
VTALATRALRVLVDGAPLSARVLSARVAYRMDQPGQCEVALALPCSCDPGASLRLELTDADDALFTGEVTAVEHEYAADGVGTLRVRGYDRLHRLRKRQELRVFEQVSAAELAERLAGPADLSVHAHGDGPRLERLVQHRHSDLELLQEVCGRAGLHLCVDGDTLHLVTLDGHGDATPLRLGRELWRIRASVNLDRAAGDATALGWDPQRALALSGHAENARSGRHTEEPDPDAVGAGGTRTLVDQPGRSEDELLALAQASYDARVAATVTVEGTAEGSASLRIGGRIAVDGVAGAVDGTYVLTEVVHTIDGDGHLTAFSSAPPPVPPSPWAASATLGVVTDVADPDGLGRVRTKLPTLGDLDAGWLSVVCPGAGSGRGIVALPDVDDTVLVLLPHGEPAAGLVIGSLYGTIAPPDEAGVADGRVGRWALTTADGQSIVVDNAGRRLRMANQVGSFVELTPDQLTLHAATDLLIEAPGRAMTVRAGSVDFQHG